MGVDIEDLGINCVPMATAAPATGSSALPPAPAHACCDAGKTEYALGGGRTLHVPRSLQQVRLTEGANTKRVLPDCRDAAAAKGQL